MPRQQKRPVCCQLIGYNGTGNTGSDIRLLMAIEDVRVAFGEQTEITVVTINPARTEAILPKDERIRVVQFYLSPIQFAVRGVYRAWKHDVTMLVEGSTFKQTWSPWLLHAYLWSAQYALMSGNSAVAYAVDVGNLTPFHTFWTRRIVNKMSLVITRTAVARDRLLAMGVKRSIIANSDTAFQYRGQNIPVKTGRPAVGVAPVEFFHWPVRLKLWDQPENRYRWPFSFRWSPERRKQSQHMIECYVRLLRHIQQNYDYDIKLIAMEDVDKDVCDRIYNALSSETRERVSVVTSSETGPEGMVAVLRGLDALVTSRYHACVLSMETAVPQMAMAHDERLKSIYSEMGIDQKYLLDYRQQQLAEKMIHTFDSMIENRQSLSQLISEMLETRFRPLCMKNRDDLKKWVQRVF